MSGTRKRDIFQIADCQALIFCVRLRVPYGS